MVSVVTACSGGPARPAPTTTAITAPLPAFNQGGSIVVAAEGEPGCMDWISTCAGSAWGVWTVETNTMPRAYDFTSDNQYKPSILLTGEAVEQTAPAQVVTYHLNPRAVWSDGQPITSADFEYTWDQIAHGQNIYNQSGYEDIASVNDADPLTAIVTFSQPYADWRQLFGGSYGILPSHLLEGQDRDSLMANGYTWSGGPWELAPGGWIHGQSIELVANPNYWGKKPDLAGVTFRIFSDPAAEMAAYAAGQVLAVYPPPEPTSNAYRSLPNTLFSVVDGLNYDALWFDVAQTPVSSKALRQAVAYSLDRTAIVGQLLGPLDPDAPPLQSLLTPAYGEFYTPSFAKYHPAPAMVIQLMTGDGWTKDHDGIWAKAGQEVTIELKVANTSPGGQLAVQLIQTQLHAAGFVVTPKPEAPTALFTSDLPAGMFAAALYPVDFRGLLGTTIPAGTGIEDNDPGQCQLFCSTSIPTPADGGIGANYGRLQDPTLDRYLADLDANPSDGERTNDANQAAAILADQVPAIPLAALPDVLVVNSAMLGVEGQTFNHNLAYGPYSYLNEWYLR